MPATAGFYTPPSGRLLYAAHEVARLRRPRIGSITPPADTRPRVGASDRDLVRAWVSYSDRWRASWLTLREDLGDLVKVLVEHLRVLGQDEKVKLVQADDGTGTVMAALPHGLLVGMRWKVGDVLDACAYPERYGWTVCPRPGTMTPAWRFAMRTACRITTSCV